MSLESEHKVVISKSNPIHFNELSTALKGSRFIISPQVEGNRYEISHENSQLDLTPITNKYSVVFYENLVEAQEDLLVLNRWADQLTYTDRISNGIVVTLCNNHVSVVSKFSGAQVKWSLFQSYVDDSLHENYTKIHSLCESIHDALISVRAIVDFAYSESGKVRELKNKYTITLVASSGIVTMSAPDFACGNVRAMDEIGDRCTIQVESPLINQKTKITQLISAVSQYCYRLEDCIKSTLKVDQSLPFNIH